jgi:hypothetical protein
VANFSLAPDSAHIEISSGKNINSVLFIDALDITFLCDTIDISLGEDTIVCGNNSLILDAENFVSYLWNDSTTGQTLTINNNSQIYVEALNSTGCVVRDTINVEFHDNPTIMVGNDFEICKGSMALLQASGADVYEWSPSYGLNDSSLQFTEASPDSTIVYTVTGTTSKGCVGTATNIVKINLPPVTNAGSDVIFVMAKIFS